MATAYAGHQFGTFAGQLGDGRAMTLGEVLGRQVSFMDFCEGKGHHSTAVTVGLR